jgi:hypothetical protein
MDDSYAKIISQVFALGNFNVHNYGKISFGGSSPTTVTLEKNITSNQTYVLKAWS